MLALNSLLILPYNTLLPVFAKVIFKGDAATFGYINSFIGLGAVCGSIFLASQKRDADLKLVLLVNSVVFGICLMVFSQLTNFPLAMLFTTLSSFGMMAQTTICSTIVQVTATREMSGRMLSYVAMAYFGMLSLGSLLIGTVSQQIGAPGTIFCQGILAPVIAAAFSKNLRKDYQQRINPIQLEDAEELVIDHS